MGKVIILTDTTDIPITQIGEMAGICWGADTKDHNKNYKRGLNCIHANHGRTLEFPQIYMEISGYSTRVIRELYTHIGGSPTRLQESTRYVNCSDFNYVMPPSINSNVRARWLYSDTMEQIAKAVTKLEEMGIPREDAAMLLPLGMETKIVYRTNLRSLVDMAAQRKCTRAYWEFRQLFKDIEESLAFYSDEWKYLIEEEKIFKIKCDVLDYCPENKGCGRKEKHNEN